MDKKILIIDDNQGDLDLIEQMLVELGFKDVISAISGEDGIRKCQEERPDIVIIDTLMPGMDGFETCKQIKDIFGAKVKAIIMTGVIDAVDAGKAKEAGVDDCCVKTSDFSSLMMSIKNVCQNE